MALKSFIYKYMNSIKVYTTIVYLYVLWYNIQVWSFLSMVRGFHTWMQFMAWSRYRGVISSQPSSFCPGTKNLKWRKGGNTVVMNSTCVSQQHFFDLLGHGHGEFRVMLRPARRTRQRCSWAFYTHLLVVAKLLAGIIILHLLATFCVTQGHWHLARSPRPGLQVATRSELC